MTPPSTPTQYITFKEFLQEALQYPCPCDFCQQETFEDTITSSQHQIESINNAWSDLFEDQEVNNYEPPLISPTNQEMHALNGNQQVHDAGNIEAINRQLAEAKDRLQQGAQPGEIFYKNIPDRFKKHFDLGKLNWLYGIPDYLSGEPDKTPPTQKEIEDFSKILDPYMKIRLQARDKAVKLDKSKTITNKEQHATNGNEDIFGHGLMPDWQKTLKIIPNTKIRKPKTTPIPTQVVYDEISRGVNPGKVATSLAPTNKEMHAYNGNPRYGPRTKAQHQRKERKKVRNVKKRAETKAYLKVIKSGIGKFPQNRPKGKALKGAAKLESKEQKLAAKYSSFLKTPTYTPPRLGSSGNNPTNLIHGYYRGTFNMSEPFDAVTNATCLLASINPVMFTQFVDATLFSCPIIICATTTPDIVPTISNITGGFKVQSYLNETSMKTAVIGSTTSSTPNPLSRFLGASITLECRCPMTTTAPPFAFGGTLAEYPSKATNPETIDINSMLHNFKIGAVRNLPESLDIPGFNVSSVYVPNTANSLLFNTLTARNSGTAPLTPVAAVPYVGLTNCPTSAVVTISVSAWFEYQENITTNAGNSVTTADFGGWNVGPKVSTEDIFDHLKRIKPTSNRVIGLGAKSNLATGFTSLLQARAAEQQPPTLDLALEISKLKKQYEKLRIQIDEEEDEKYFDTEVTPTLDKQQTPNYSGLSKSTIDLAMSLKKSLTPGSVTNKTILKFPQ